MNESLQLSHRQSASTRRGLLHAIAAAVAFSTTAGPLEASERLVSVALHAPKECPTRDVLLRDASARVPALRFSDDVAATVAIRVGIAAKRRGFGAKIEMERDGSVERRELVADTCEELVEAAGLLIALFVKPDATVAAESALPDEPPEVPRRNEPELREPPRVETNLARDTPPKEAERRSPTNYGLLAGANLQTEAATFPALALGAGLFVGIERVGRDARVLAPSFRLEAALASSDLVAGPGRQGSLVRGTLRLDGCPIRVAIGTHGSLRPCVWAGAGVVRASGSAVENAQADTEGWADLGARLRVRLQGARLFAELDAGAIAPLTRPAIVTQNPTAIVHETPAIGALFSIGAGYRFF